MKRTASSTFALFLFIALFSIPQAEGTSRPSMESNQSWNYVITETSRYSSLDPLDADATQNLPVARMLYLTPFEMSQNDTLKSGLLEHFEFSTEKNEATWIVRKGLTFDNGTPITAEDVAFSVTRMAFARPLFPVIREIIGIQEWKQSNNALSDLPKGISINGQKISIRFSKPVDHPLFRFSLELFSVIPKSCVDLKTNKLICDKPPASGYFRIKNESQDEIVFESRNKFHDSVLSPNQKIIRFQYKEPASVFEKEKMWPERTVIAANESSFSDEELTQLPNLFQIRPLPKNRFAGLLLNPNVKAFSTPECRNSFLHRFREKLIELGTPKKDVESSLTMAILPGYLSWEELQERSGAVTKNHLENCAKELSKNPVEFSVWEGQRFLRAENAVLAALASFGQRVNSPSVQPSRAIVIEKFLKGESPFLLVGSGFWPQDPFGDLQMLFTPNLHKQLQFISPDEELQALIEQLRTPLPPKQKRMLAEKLNLLIFSKGLLGVYRHTKRFYLSPKTSEYKVVPLALTSPSPWQVFEK